MVEDELIDICVTLILDFCRDILEDQTDIDDVTIAHVNRFCQEWINENFGKDQTIIEEIPNPLFGGNSCFGDTNLTQSQNDTNSSRI